MECTACEDDGAATVTVEYTNGRTEELALCADCREEFAAGEFVQSVR